MNKIEVKLNLCDVFGVEPEQIFWVKKDKKYRRCVIDKNNNFYIYELSDVPFEYSKKHVQLSVEDIYSNNFYYERPKEVNENTKQFLRLIGDDFNVICRLTNEIYMIKDDFDLDNDFTILPDYFKIDLSELEIGKEYKISELLGDDDLTKVK